MLRQEVYADDADDDATPEQRRRAATPYTVTEQNFTVRPVQPRGGNRHAVFFTHGREAITWHYERDPSDPRVQHALTLAVDEYGNVLQQASIGYGRRRPDASLPTDEDRERQARIHITATENVVTNAIELTDHHRAPVSAESRTYEVRRPRQDLSGAGATELYGFDRVVGLLDQSADGDHEIAYEDHDFAAAQQAAAGDSAEAQRYFRRLIEHVRTHYRPDDCGVSQGDPSAVLPVGRIETLALIGESYQLAFTAGLLADIFKRPREGQPDELLLPDPGAVLGGTAGDRGGYVDLEGDGSWWIPSGRSFFHPDDVAAAVELAEAEEHFFLPRRHRDPFDHDAAVDFDTPHDLLPIETRDALGNRVEVVANDYRVLQPRLVSDPNGNRTEVAFDVLGMVVGTAVMGKPPPAVVEGDSLTGFVVDVADVDADDFFAAPRQPSPAGAASEAAAIAHDLLGEATTRIVYDVTRYLRLGEPVLAATIARETHAGELSPGQRSKLQISFTYADGFGREIQKKVQAEPGPLVGGGPITAPRWIGSGWTIFDNKGQPVRQYEPFFSATHDFEFAVTVGVSPVLFYDPTGRVVTTLRPDHTYDKVVFDPWQQTTYDGNDTCYERDDQTGDPRTDPDIHGFVAGYFEALGPTASDWKTWHARRIDGDLGADERIAAQRAAAHADTPTTEHLDALGRPFLTISRNRVVCADHDLDGTEETTSDPGRTGHRGQPTGGS